MSRRFSVEVYSRNVKMIQVTINAHTNPSGPFFIILLETRNNIIECICIQLVKPLANGENWCSFTLPENYRVAQCNKASVKHSLFTGVLERFRLKRSR